MKRIFKNLKKYFFLYFFLDVSFLIAIFLLFSYVRKKLSFYLLEIQNLSSQIISIQQTMNISMVEGLLNTINSITQKAMILMYLVVPLAIFLFWIFSQGTVFAFIKKEKLSWKYYGKFSLITAPFFIISIFLVDKFFSRLSEIIFGLEIKYFLVFIPLIILLYFLFSLYSIFPKFSIKELRNALIKILKFSYGAFPPFILFITLSFAVLFSAFNVYVNLQAGKIDSILKNVVFVIVEIVLLIFLRQLLVYLFTKKK